MFFSIKVMGPASPYPELGSYVAVSQMSVGTPSQREGGFGLLLLHQFQ